MGIFCHKRHMQNTKMIYIVISHWNLSKVNNFTNAKIYMQKNNEVSSSNSKSLENINVYYEWNK